MSMLLLAPAACALTYEFPQGRKREGGKTDSRPETVAQGGLRCQDLTHMCICVEQCFCYTLLKINRVF